MGFGKGKEELTRRNVACGSKACLPLSRGRASDRVQDRGQLPKPFSAASHSCSGLLLPRPLAEPP
jgi:hypothetical protein